MTPEQRHKFLLNRRGLGSSTMPKILGISPWGDSSTAYDEVVSVLDGNVPFEQETNLDMERGNNLEPIAANAFSARTGKVLRRVGQRKHPEYNFLIANCDRLICASNGDPTSILEIKSPRKEKALYVRDYGPLDEYWVQIQHQLGIMAAINPDAYLSAFLCVYHTDIDPVISEIKRDDEWIQGVLVPAAKNFWFDHVEPRIRPEIVRAEEVVIPKMSAGEVKVDDSVEFEGLAEDLMEAKIGVEESQEKYGHARTSMEAYILDKGLYGSPVEGSGVRVTNGPKRGGLRLDKPKLQAKLQSIGEDFSDYQYRGAPGSQFILSTPKRLQEHNNSKKEVQ